MLEVFIVDCSDFTRDIYKALSSRLLIFFKGYKGYAPHDAGFTPRSP